MLRAAGVRSVAQAEPPHGAQFRILHGRVAGAKIFATVGRDDSALIGRRTEVRRREHDGVEVRVLADEDARYVSFRDHGVTWLLFDHPRTTPPDCMRVLVELAWALIDAA